MKFILAALAVFLLFPSARAETPSAPFNPPGPFMGTSKILFDEPTHQFGSTQQGVEVRHRFNFKNAGTGDLVIFSAKGSCGCTAAMVSSGPFKPGDSGYIDVTYDSRGKFGRVFKDVRVDSNDPSSPTMIALEGMVLEPHHPTMATGDVLFKGSCAECHAIPAKGKEGKELYEAACMMCHDPVEASKKMAPPRQDLAFVAGKNLKKNIADGIPRTSMPGFSMKHGGPLTKEQIKSLVKYLESLKTKD